MNDGVYVENLKAHKHVLPEGEYKFRSEVHSSCSDSVTVARRSFLRAQGVPEGSPATAESKPGNKPVNRGPDLRGQQNEIPDAGMLLSFTVYRGYAFPGLWAEIQDKMMHVAASI